jgi:asparagine synthase (glutamine-hydrolysing)
MALAWTPSSRSPWVGGQSVCLIEGRARTDELAEHLGLDPAIPPEKLVSNGYERLGDGVLELLDGHFALVAWDGRKRRGVLARDRLGSVPMFVAEWRGMLLFASEVRNLLALLPSAPAPDPEAMAHWLARTTVVTSRTLYSGIERLTAAQAVSLSPHGWRRRRWWEPRYRTPRAIDFRGAAEEIRAGLERAVSRSLEGAERPAVMLSGGLDSAAVAVFAPGLSAAYSAVFPGHPEVDESAGIANARNWLGTNGVEMRFRNGSALAAGAEFLHEWQMPSVSPNPFVWLPLLRRAAADGVDVLLDGEGGDELFGCAPYLVADRLRTRRPLDGLRVARRLPGMGDRPPLRRQVRALRSYGARAALPYGIHELLRTVRSRGAVGPQWLTDDTERLHRRDHDPWAWKRIGAPRWWAQLAYALTSTGDALGAPDQFRRVGRLCGVELRHPLRDPELVDLMLGMPPELSFDAHVDRPLVRAMLVGDLPESTLSDDRKPVFNSLLETALAGPDAETLHEMLRDPHPELARRVRRAAVATMADQPSEGPVSRALDLWRIASLEMWLEQLANPAALAGRYASVEAEFVALPADPRQHSGE